MNKTGTAIALLLAAFALSCTQKEESPQPAQPAAAGDVERKVTEIVCEIMGADKSQVSLDTSLAGDLGADDLDIVEIVMEIEDAYEIVIPDEAFENIRTVRDAVQYVHKIRRGTR